MDIVERVSALDKRRTQIKSLLIILNQHGKYICSHSPSPAKANVAHQYQHFFPDVSSEYISAQDS